MSRRHLLQWGPSSEVERTRAGGLGGVAARDVVRAGAARSRVGRRACAAAAAGAARSPRRSCCCGCFARCSRGGSGGRGRIARAALDADAARFLRRLARRTWAFFETYVTAADNWLPPDNVQEQPTAGRGPPHVADQHRPVAARRTSPRYDFGYLAGRRRSMRTRNTLETLESLRAPSRPFLQLVRHATRCSRCRRATCPRSTAATCAGHLLTLRQGLLALPDAPVLSTARRSRDSPTRFAVLDETSAADPPTGVVPRSQRRAPAGADEPAPATLAAHAGTSSRELVAATGASHEALVWATALHRKCLSRHVQLAVLRARCAKCANTARRARRVRARACASLADAAACRLACATRASRRLTPRSVRALDAESPSLERLAASADEFAQMDYAVPVRPTGDACCRSATTSTTTASTPATTTCWPRKPASPASSPSPRASCRRRTGSPWADC